MSRDNCGARDLLRGICMRYGDLEVRIAVSHEEVLASQELRYRVFCGGNGEACVQSGEDAKKIDVDRFDDFCHHLVVIDLSRSARVIASYRLITRDAASKCGGFYSSSEFDMSCMDLYKGNVLELGRACVDPLYRSKKAFNMLLKWLDRYVKLFHIDVMFGCASFYGTQEEDFKNALSLLYYRHLAPPQLRPKVRKGLGIDMKMLPEECIDYARAEQEMPSLMKGYLKIGAVVGDGAFLDKQFNCIDVCVIVFANSLSRDYLKRFFDICS
ncbi:GNAT family N-acetyltransferase [Candidatus Hydrogenosomobacter endosymbioticus]|uniref:L-ornithine N(alpha)-acyltransferase n=1 Tax=Candidatus Hydrogenosomobacter endosymbioticus TaxID=2558174 RepID=A0ABM7V9D5_9PROT|nr:GNAT family N-acyltransferase [Candidatus Hydrogenosomobacter endosymbioticus]BDB96424.1 ornithine-acyl ACP N-acyltransferase [Candidatus Hydrogenosomobacter endosymbioticus]